MTDDLQWDALFGFLEAKVNFRKVKSKDTWTCDNQLTFTKEFCDANNLDFEKIKATLNTFGGFCDCEVLFNSADHLEGRYIFAALDHKEQSSPKGEKE